MTCKEVQALITAAVDGELDEKTMKEFFAALDKCEHCRAEYEAELQTKRLIRQKIKKIKAPQSLVDAITRQTIGKTDSSNAPFDAAVAVQADMAESQRQTLGSWKQALLEAIYVNPSAQSRSHTIFAAGLAISILAMLIFAGFVRQRQNAFDAEMQIEASAKSNIFDIASQMFREPQTPDIKSKDASVIANHIREIFGVPVVIPTVRMFHPSSARVGAFGNVNVGEVRFVHDKDPKTVVAVYIARESEALKNATIEEEIMRYISENGRNFYRKTCPSGSQVVVWKWGEMIYAATTNNAEVNLLAAISNPHWLN
ncbi:MAG: zf-HC2 domain-containing protein [Chloroherpetonaceae bacterium]|nr:zf-HC2 domain-containing protein [Chloroherpetonaceae bacterium]MDW8437231.1 zf-HC2 domain-containing protein [Chloroherpetonaceae bacterium]